MKNSKQKISRSVSFVKQGSRTSYTFICAGTRSSYLGFWALCLSWNILYLGFPMNTNWFSKIYSTHYSQEPCITRMLLIYFHTLPCRLCKQITNKHVHVVCTDKPSSAEEPPSTKCGKITRIWAEIASCCLAPCMCFWGPGCRSAACREMRLWTRHIALKWPVAQSVV